MLTSKIDVDEARIAGGCLLSLKDGAVLHALKQASKNVPFPRQDLPRPRRTTSGMRRPPAILWTSSAFTGRDLRKTLARRGPGIMTRTPCGDAPDG